MSNQSDGYSYLLASMLSSIADTVKSSLSSILNVSGALSDLIKTITDSGAFTSVGLSLSLNAAQDVMASYQTLVSSYNLMGTTAQLVNLSEDLSNWLVDIVRSAMPYVQAADRAEYEDVILPQLKKGGVTRLTVGDILQIISLLLTALTIVITLLPDTQQAKIIEQNDKIIALEEERVALEREREDDLNEVAYTLAEAINSLSNELADMRELAEDSNDSGVLNDQPDKPDCENQNGD